MHPASVSVKTPAYLAFVWHMYCAESSMKQINYLKYVLNNIYYWCVISGYQCEFVPGDGTGGTEIGQGQIGTANDCVNLCAKLQETENSEINGVTISVSNPDNPSCYCEVGMTGPNSSGSYKTCFLTKGKP